MKLAIERAKAVKIIQGDFGRQNGFFKEKRRGNSEKLSASGEEKRGDEEKRENSLRKKNGRFGENFKGKTSGKECWSCGKEGRFRFECPGTQGNAE